MRYIVEGGMENIRSKPATAGLPPWGVLPIPLVSAEAMPKFHACLCLLPVAVHLCTNSTTSFRKGS